MATVKNKKLDKMTVVNFAANFCAIFSLILVVALLTLANAFGSNRAALAGLSQSAPQSCAADGANTASVAVPAVLFPVSADNPSENTIRVVVDDGGWDRPQIDLSLSSARMIEITNKGVNPHSFVIDDLGIDSGAILPGTVKTVILQNLSDQAGDYVFYSNYGNDNKDEFAGRIVTN